MTESERELLELAAKAAGYEVEFGQGLAFNHEGTVPQSWADWNPLEDDGDALRLAVKLGIDVRFISHQYPGDSVMSKSSLIGDYSLSIEFLDEVERFSAVRRAIVRAAAEIGMAMP